MSNKLWLKSNGNWSSMGMGSDSIPSGANGVSGFLPDYDKGISIPGEITTEAPYSIFTTSESPDDGWIRIYGNLKSITNDTYIGCFILTELGSKNLGLYNAIRQNANSFFIPVRKNDKVRLESNFVFHRSNNPDIDITFYPIYKPDFTQEHIVGYLGDKPIYEKIINCISGSEINKYSHILSENLLQNLNIISVSGILIDNNRNFLPIPFCDYGNTVYSIFIGVTPQGNISERHNHTDYNSCNITLTIKYTKTTD